MYQQAVNGIIPRVQTGMFSQLQATGRIGAIQGYGNTARQTSSLETMRVYVLQDAPRTFIRSQRAAMAKGTYRMDGDPNRYSDWASQETQQSAVTGMRRLKLSEEDDFIQKHLDRLIDRGEDSALLQQPEENSSPTTEPVEEVAEAVQEPCPPIDNQTGEAQVRIIKIGGEAECLRLDNTQYQTNPAISGNIGTQLLR